MDPKDFEGKSPEELTQMLIEKDKALKQAEQDKTATIGELKDLRTKKQELEQQIEKATKAEETPGGGESPEAQFEAFLQKKQQEESKKNRDKAIEDFRASQHEFSEAADPGGIKFAAFEREMSKFNFSNLTSVDEYKSRLREVHEFMNRSKKDDDTVNVHRGTNRAPADNADRGDEHALDTVEKQLVDKMGWTTERYLKLKEKMPDYIETQLNYIR